MSTETFDWGRCYFTVQNNNHVNNRCSMGSYCVLCGKSRRCDIVTKGWLSVSIGVILLSASMVSILVNKSMNSLLSAFSASMSLPSRSDVMFTCRNKTNTQASYHSSFQILFERLSIQGQTKTSPTVYSHRETY